MISIEQNFADNLQVDIGDVLGFRIGSRIIQAPIASIRSVDWATFRPNFYIIFPPLRV